MATKEITGNMNTGTTGVQPDKVSSRKQEKEIKRRKMYLNSMVTRGEVLQEVNAIKELLAVHQEQMKLEYIQIRTLMRLLTEGDKAITTIGELDKLSIPYVEELYGKQEDAPKEGDNIGKD